MVVVSGKDTIKMCVVEKNYEYSYDGEIWKLVVGLMINWCELWVMRLKVFSSQIIWCKL
jgi:hypothetical protein